MSLTADLATARRLLGTDLLGPDEIRAAFDTIVPAPPIPYSVAALETATANGELLILRVDHDSSGLLTLLRLIDRFPDAFDQQFLRKSGYLLKDEWGIALEPIAKTDHCVTGWMLVRKHILDETRNLSYDDQTQQLIRYAARLKAAPSTIRRRTAVEAVYDLILFRAARGERLLRDAWDWSASQTLDAGFLNVGGFGTGGLQILSYSPAVRHGALGVCPARLP